MSSLLKQDTYYSEFGNSGLLYTYPTSASIKLGSSERITVFSRPSSIEKDTEIVSSSTVTGMLPQKLEFGAATLEGGNSATLFFKLQKIRVPSTAHVAKDTSLVFVYADFEYKQEDKVHSLEGHSFMLTGD